VQVAFWIVRAAKHEESCSIQQLDSNDTRDYLYPQYGLFPASPESNMQQCVYLYAVIVYVPYWQLSCGSSGADSTTSASMIASSCLRDGTGA
jgi:hypothetical protein